MKFANFAILPILVLCLLSLVMFTVTPAQAKTVPTVTVTFVSVYNELQLLPVYPACVQAPTITIKIVNQTKKTAAITVAYAFGHNKYTVKKGKSITVKDSFALGSNGNYYNIGVDAEELPINRIVTFWHC